MKMKYGSFDAVARPLGLDIKATPKKFNKKRYLKQLEMLKDTHKELAKYLGVK